MDFVGEWETTDGVRLKITRQDSDYYKIEWNWLDNGYCNSEVRPINVTTSEWAMIFGPPIYGSTRLMTFPEEDSIELGIYKFMRLQH